MSLIESISVLHNIQYMIFKILIEVIVALSSTNATQCIMDNTQIASVHYVYAKCSKWPLRSQLLFATEIIH